MSERILMYYMVVNPYNILWCYVVAVYLDGRNRIWRYGDKGFKSARKKALRSYR